jgi:hypothetical protein
MPLIQLPVNPARVCAGLSKIGYMPPSAIADIIDNSVRAEAQNVYVRIEAEQAAPQTRLNNVREYLIIDDGTGMDEDAMMNALALGSSTDDYEPHSLSKFGLGLKSAAFSQGEQLELISSPGGAPFIKLVVSLPIVQATNEYMAEQEALTDEDQRLIEEYLGEGRGTIVRIAQVRKVNHPSIATTLEALRMKAGAIYYYMMRDNNLRLFVNGEECQPFDVLFTEEADTNGNLDENTWDGRTTRWIERPKSVLVDPERNVNVTVEATQLPHPPTFRLDGPQDQARVRDKYKIGAGNYGYYVYRNKRLLSWAESLGLIPQDQDFYSFRGRILIDDSADETFNIDVKKSHIHLSEVASEALDDLSAEYRRKSKRAWQRAKEALNQRLNEQNAGVGLANQLAQQTVMPEELPGSLETEAQYEEAKRREQELLEEQRKRDLELLAQAEGSAALPEELAGEEVGEAEGTFTPTEEQIRSIVTGGTATPGDKIFMVPNTEDNVLWEPYYDAEMGVCVRINKLHRFSKVIFDDNPNNGALRTLMGLLMLQLAGAERYVQRSSEYNRVQIEAILAEYRRASTEFLAKMCRDLGDSLPSE